MLVRGSRRALASVVVGVVLISAGLSAPAVAARDTDRDGMPDTFERKYRLNLRKNDAKADPDRDGLSNLREFRKKTNPRKKDTDGDLWIDGVEVKRRTNPLNKFDPCPFTGLKARSRAGRIAVGVVVDNADTSRPQTGLETADIVIEHPIEAGHTRFIPIYGCKKAKSVGPVRSARFDVTQIMRPFTKALAYSGANAMVQTHLMNKEIIFSTEATAPTAFTRSSAPAPDNLFVDTTKVRSAPIAGRPFRFGKLQSGTAVTQVTLNFGGTFNAQWLASGKKWLRFDDALPSMSASGKRLAADNVIVQVVDVQNSDALFDPAGNPSPDFKFPRGGVAYLFRSGKVITGTWTLVNGKPKFVNAGGKAFSLGVGRTWIEMVPSPDGDVKGTVTFS